MVTVQVIHEDVPRSDIEGPPPLTGGDLLAPGYRVVTHLRRGERLDVYDVWSEERDCRCVAKGLRPDCIDDRPARRRLIREGQLLRRLTHPHIVRAYEILEHPSPFVILETLTGATLSRLIADRRRPLRVGEVVFLGLHLCSAMRYLHRHGFLHLDLKPSNIVSDRGLAKVLDLSLAQPPGPGHRGWGTPQYMAPEQARGTIVTEATDVWGIGVVLFTAVTGRRPFAADDEGRYEQLERRAESVRALRRVPAALAMAVDGCLEPDPARRPPVDDLSRMLRGVLDLQPEVPEPACREIGVGGTEAKLEPER